MYYCIVADECALENAPNIQVFDCLCTTNEVSGALTMKQECQGCILMCTRPINDAESLYIGKSAQYQVHDTLIKSITHWSMRLGLHTNAPGNSLKNYIHSKSLFVPAEMSSHLLGHKKIFTSTQCTKMEFTRILSGLLSMKN